MAFNRYATGTIHLIPSDSERIRRVASPKKLTDLSKDYLYVEVDGLHWSTDSDFRPNDNGDAFHKNELLRKRSDNQYVYQTWNRKGVFKQHHSEDVGGENHIGIILDTYPHFKESSIKMLTALDRKRDMELIKRIEAGKHTDVSMGCFPLGTKILTNIGFQLIEEIDINNKLIDANGNFVNIINKQTYEYDGNLISFNIEGNSQVEATDEHPFLIISKNDWKKRNNKVRARGKGNRAKWINKTLEPIWVEAKNLQIGDRVLIPIGGEEVNIEGLTIGKARLIGYFLAEGSYCKYNGKHKQIQFNFSIKETNTLASEVVKLMKQEFDVTANICIRKNKNICVVSASGSNIIKWFYKMCGEYSHEKKMDQSLLFSPIEIQKHILGAWLSGDGCIHKIPTYPKSNTISGVTTSQELATQLNILFNRTGIAHTKFVKLNKKSMKFSEAIQLPKEQIIGNDGKKIVFAFEIPSNYCNLIYPYTKFKNGKFSDRKTFLINFNNYISRPITKIEKIPYKGLVYNFQTETNNYLVEGIVTHNCSVEQAVCSECGNIARNMNDICAHVRQYKGKINPRTGNMVFEWNYGVTGNEISYVTIGADKDAKVRHILCNKDEINLDLTQIGHILQSHSNKLANEIGNNFLRIASKKENISKEDLIFVNSVTSILEGFLEK